MRLARRQIGLGAFQITYVIVRLHDDLPWRITDRNPAPATDDENALACLIVVDKLTLPHALLRDMGADGFKGNWPFGSQQFVYYFADRLILAPAVELFASRTPAANDAIEAMDDNIGSSQDAGHVIQAALACVRRCILLVHMVRNLMI
ncbi:hypothetical protein thsrh120_31990 [Rhizobium sp. No.120]